MDNQADKVAFYEEFWADAGYQQAYAFDSAVRDRFPAIKKVWGDLRLPGRVLDYGCGNGVLTYWLWSNGFGREVLGIDVSQTGVNHAKGSFGREGLAFATIDTLNDHALLGFDVVVSSHVLEHIDQPEIVLAFIAEQAEWIVLEVPLEKCIWPTLLACLKGKSRIDNPLRHVNFWNKSTFKQFLKNSGLLVIRDYQYVSAPYSPFNHWLKRGLELIALKLIGIRLYSKLLATHYIVLVRKIKKSDSA
jgi:SAM-dependent methyltransferase